MESTSIPGTLETTEPAQGLITIERVVAFIVGPTLGIAAGVASAWLAKHLGINIQPAELSGVFIATETGVIALAWKWLHGRQIEEKAKQLGIPLAPIIGRIGGAAPPIPPAPGDPAPSGDLADEGAASGS